MNPDDINQTDGQNPLSAAAPSPAPAAPVAPEMGQPGTSPEMGQPGVTPEVAQSSVTPQVAQPSATPGLSEPSFEAGPEATMSTESFFEGVQKPTSIGATNGGTPSPDSFAPSAAAGMAGQNISATDPILERDPIKEPDPVEEALKAPIKAAAPVPGSIGSAVSMSTESQTATPTPSATKAKNSKMVIYILVGVVILGLIGALLYLLLGNNKNGSNGSAGGTQSANVVYKEYSCKRTLSSSELLAISGANDGAEYLTAEFGDDELINITLSLSASYSDSSAAGVGRDVVRKKYADSYKKLGYESDPFTTEYSVNGNIMDASHSTNAENLTKDNLSLFNLSLKSDKSLGTDFETVKNKYRNLGFTCETQ